MWTEVLAHLGPWDAAAPILATLAVLWMLWSREFASIPREVLTRGEGA